MSLCGNIPVPPGLELSPSDIHVSPRAVLQFFFADSLLVCSSVLRPTDVDDLLILFDHENRLILKSTISV